MLSFSIRSKRSRPTRTQAFASDARGAGGGPRGRSWKQPALHWSALHGVCAEAVHVGMLDDDTEWFAEIDRHIVPLRDFAAVIMRKDPPFDMEYITSSWLLERAEKEGARVFNRPQALRDHSEKLSVLEFAQFSVPALVAREAALVSGSVDLHRDVILKPLDGMGGSQILSRPPRRPESQRDHRNALTHEGARTIMACATSPEIAEGDKRILIVGGEVAPYCPARIPKAGETRGNPAAGGTGVARELSARDREIAETLAPAGGARVVAGRHRRDRGLADRNQHHQPDVHGRDRRTDGF